MSTVQRPSKPLARFTPTEIGNSDLPVWQVATLSLVVIAALYLGMAMERLGSTRYTEILGAIPVLICALYFIRIPPVQPLRIRWVFRAALLLLPFLPIFFASYEFPPLTRNASSAWAFVVIQTIAIGVTEEFTFRFSLHRLWSRYGAAFFVVASSLLFGALHYPLGWQVSIIATVIGFAFAVSRAAGMPLLVLILLHAFYDGPAIYASMA